MTSVSVLIPAFNAAETLNATIESVVAQTCPDWELIVFDDRSADGTAELAKAWSRRDPRIRVIGGAARGAARARNQAAQHATAPWLLFLDADDLIVEHHLATMLAAASLNPRPDFVYAAGARLAPDGRIGATEIPPAEDLFRHFGRCNPLYTHACLVRRTTFEAFGGFDTSLAICEDWDLWQRLARSGTATAAIDACVALYRMRPSSLSRNVDVLFADARKVIGRMHGPDPRVRNPVAAHAEGLPATDLPAALIGIATWCAANMIGAGQDPTRFLQSAALPQVAEMAVDGPVSMMQGGVPNGALALQEDWPHLWTHRKASICATFAIIEQSCAITEFAARCSGELERRLSTASESHRLDVRSEPSVAMPRSEVADAFVGNLPRPPISSVMIVAAHPDDELIGAGGHLACWPGLTVVHVTDGAPREGQYAQRLGFSDPAAYAGARRREAESALAIVGLAPERIIALGFKDQEASLHLPDLSRHLLALFVAERPDVIVTHAYEGGHPDHDATCFAVQAACRLAERDEEAPARVEMSSYFGRDGIRITSCFLSLDPPSNAVSLTAESRECKHRMLACHRSQREIIRLFPVGIENFRRAPIYDFRAAPHSGRLFYEYHDLGMDGARWRALAAAATAELKL